MKKLLLLFAYLLAPIHSQAQGVDECDSDSAINVIKLDTTFVYAESTMRDGIEALSGAKAILELKIHEWLRNINSNENAGLLVLNSKDKWCNLLTARGNYKRVFVYVRKSDVLPSYGETAPIMADIIPDQEEESDHVLTIEEEDMAAIDTFDALEPYVKEMKGKGRVEAYGKYASLPEYTLCYIFVYDRDGIVLAVLRQSEDGKYLNLRNQEEDNIRYYKNCGAIWLQLK